MATVSIELVLTLCATVFIIFKTIDYFIKKRNDSELIKSLGELKTMVDGVQITLDKLWNIHNRYDENGSPLWYVPRNWAFTQQKIVETMQEIAHTQQNIAETLRRMEERH